MTTKTIDPHQLSDKSTVSAVAKRIKHTLMSVAMVFGLAMAGWVAPAAAQGPTPGPTLPPNTTQNNQAPEATCKGRFINPFTDICWRCIFPISVSVVDFSLVKNQEDNDSSEKEALCSCKNNVGIPIPGIPTGFWEPSRIFEAVRKPFCFPTLSGLSIDLPFPAPGHTQHSNAYARAKFGDFAAYNDHMINASWLHILEVQKDNGCVEKTLFDISYMGELDPLSHDDAAAFLLNPDAVIYANPAAQAACALDCVAASTGFAKANIYWCAGCQGSIFPLSRNIGAFVGGVQASTLLMQRTMFRMHREGLMLNAAGKEAQCGYQFQPIMDKRNYKYNLLYPQRQGIKDSRCCQPFGRSTVEIEAGKEVPYTGEDFTMMVFRKRDCCSSNLLQAAAQGGGSATSTGLQSGAGGSP